MLDFCVRIISRIGHIVTAVIEGRSDIDSGIDDIFKAEHMSPPPLSSSSSSSEGLRAVALLVLLVLPILKRLVLDALVSWRWLAIRTNEALPHRAVWSCVIFIFTFPALSGIPRELRLLSLVTKLALPVTLIVSFSWWSVSG